MAKRAGGTPFRRQGEPALRKAKSRSAQVEGAHRSPRRRCSGNGSKRAQQAAPLGDIATATRLGEESGSKLPHSKETWRGSVWSAGGQAALQRAQHAVPLRFIGENDLKDRAEGTSGPRAAGGSKTKRAGGTPFRRQGEPALRKAKPRSAQVEGAHRSPRRRCSGHSMLCPYGRLVRLRRRIGRTGRLGVESPIVLRRKEPAGRPSVVRVNRRYEKRNPEAHRLRAHTDHRVGAAAGTAASGRSKQRP